MKEIILNQFKVAWAISVMMVLMIFILAIDKLPNLIAVQFDLAGRPMMWWSIGTFTTVFASIIIFINGFFGLFASPLIERVPFCLITLPFKKRWLKLKMGDELYCERVQNIVSVPPFFINTILFLIINSIMYVNDVMRFFTFSSLTLGVLIGLLFSMMVGIMIYYAIPPNEDE